MASELSFRGGATGGFRIRDLVESHLLESLFQTFFTQQLQEVRETSLP
jgi:hypothetical protein